jgi:alanine racemase
MPVGEAAVDPDAPQAHVDLAALQRNAATIRARLPSTTALLAAVKADGYGHGALRVAHALAGRVAAFGVATATEAFELRAGGIAEPILLLAPVRHRLAALVAAGIDVCVAHRDDLQALEGAGVRGARVHVKVDTGMGRLGPSGSEALGLWRAALRSRAVEVVGLFTHLARADEPEGIDATRQALASFDALVTAVERAGERPRWVHAANSAAALSLPEAHYDLVRPGIALYARPAAPFPGEGLANVMRVDAPVTFVKRVPAGTTIGYGGTFVAEHATVIATVRFGYADGYPRALSSRGVAGLRGREVRVAGRVCMDQLMLDLGPDGDAEVGERIDFIGGGAPDAAAVANAAGSFVYELLTGIGARVVRRSGR